ncbi:MAG: OmpA family protein [Hyphomicrobiaceae bacterium]
MKCNPWRWLWGIPLIGMWLWIAILAERDNIQNDLRERSSLALHQAGYSFATPSFAGRDGFVTGRTSRIDYPDKAVQTIRDVWGVRLANQNIKVVEVVSDYKWSAVREAGAVTLGGFVPSEKDRADIVAYFKRRFAKLEVIDQMTLTPGAPKHTVWMQGVKFAGKQLVSLNSGSARLDNTALSLSGDAVDFVAFKGVKAALARGRPDGITLAADNITPPVISPYTWTLKRSRTELLLAGHVPSEELRRQLFSRAKELYSDTAIIDRMQTAAGEPENWSRAAETSLEQLGQLETGSAEMSDQNLMLKGRAANQDVADRVRQSWNNGIPATFELTDNITFPKPKPPVITPYVTEILSRNDSVEVKGYVPSEDVRTSLLQQIRTAFPARTTIDRLQLGSGMLDGWRGCLTAGIDGLAKIEEGQLTLRDRNLLVTGKTKDENLASQLPNEVRVAANRSCDTEVRVAADVPPEPSLEWKAEHAGEGRLVITGRVPDAATKAALIKRSGELFIGAEIIDQTDIAYVDPRNWQLAAIAALEQLARLRTGSVVISRQDVLLRGEAKDTAISTAVKDKITTGLPKEYGGRHEISVRSDSQIWAEEEARKKAEAAKLEEEAKAREAAEAEARKRQAEAEEEARQLEQQRKKAEEEAALSRQRANEAESKRNEELQARRKAANRCEKLLKSAASEGSIRFGWASADLTAKSRPTLRRLAKIANQCPEFQIEIEGHTDAEGTPERNQLLSERRAQSVVDFLKNSGVDGNRLSAVGYGEKRPIAPNDTAASRAKNRRIDFGVKVD